MNTWFECNRCACQTCSVVTCALCAIFIVCAPPAASAEGLDEAYRTELTRLKAEESAMRDALRAAKSRGKKSRAGLVGEIESLARSLTRLRADNTKSEMQLPHTERMHSMQEQSRSINRRNGQIETWLETRGVRLSPSVGSTADEGVRHQHPPLDKMVTAALDYVEERGQLWVRKNQEYFDDDGVATAGSVLRIAEVGAVAVGSTLRPLELALDGSLRVTGRFPSPEVSHGDSRTVGVVLFDPRDVRPSATKADGWYAWIERGGVVMWAIALLAVLAFLLFVERVLAFARYVLRLTAAERLGPKVAVPEGDVLLRAVGVVQTSQGDADELETQAAEAILQTQAFVRRGVSLLAVVDAVAPLLGLLGTVTGMIGTFAMITEHGTGDPRLLSGGISEALLTTQFGLMVAIPALLLQTTLYRSGDAILRRIEKFALAALQVRVEVMSASARSENVIPVRSAR